jgi:hypothetical protein
VFACSRFLLLLLLTLLKDELDAWVNFVQDPIQTVHHRGLFRRLHQLPLIVAQNSGDNNFRFVDCEEATGACLSAIAENKMIGACGYGLGMR